MSRSMEDAGLITLFPKTIFDFSFLAMSAVIALLVGCNACEQEECSDRLHIVLVKATAWPPGMYAFEILSDGDAVSCTLTLPRAVADLIGTCDSSGFSLASADANSISSIIVRDSPDRVEFTISLDGAAFNEGSLEPDYHEPVDWMRRCGPPCDEATVEHAIP